MGTSAGPSLQGIGRGGASHLVLEMDAHDAKSYPGEPTSNILTNPNFIGGTTTTWSLDGTGASITAVADSDNPVNSPYILKVVQGSSTTNVYTDLINKTLQGSNYTFTCWAKGVGTMGMRSYDNNSGSVSASAVTLTDEWQLITLNATFNGADSTTMCRFYVCDDLTGDYAYIAGPQCERKGYATPYVWDGYNGRPTSTNLMIHGNVGTGTSFEDSSPSKHTVTASGNTTHSSDQSKFSGGSIYFDGADDYLSVANHTDFAFGSGDFTVDAWIYGTDAAQNEQTIFAKDFATDYGWILNFATGSGNGYDQIGFLYSTDGSSWASTTRFTSGVTANTWHHIAICRYFSSGEGNSINTINVFVDGTSVGTLTGVGTFNADGAAFLIGAYQTGSVEGDFDGYIDEARVTKGTALWRGNFTPPTRRNLNAPVVDRSGSNNGGNFATVDMTDVATYRVGEVIRPIDSAVWDFDGTDDVIDLGNINYNGLTGLTVATWVYSSNFAANDSFLSSWGDNSNSNYAWLLFASQWVSTKIEWLISTNGTSYTRCAGTLGLTNNLWYHIVGTWNSSGAMVLYINGALDGTATGPASIMNNDFNTFIGCDSDGSSEAKVRFFGGQMGNATIWKTTLTAAQVEQNFNQQRSRFGV
jgi:hypothetical protein